MAAGFRVLTPGGRLAVYTTGVELRGTPAAPEPLASHAYFRSDDELVDLGRRAGFTDAAVGNDNGGQLLTVANPPPGTSINICIEPANRIRPAA